MEPNLQPLAKMIIFLGIILIVAGLIIYFFKGIPFGKLPGDIHIEKKNFSFYFPITTSILLSVIISLLLYIISKR
ncbi:MAG: DUF2905 domain-containing protein [candidate division KSB1 bacterium]|nr:DUF2905 domain-containing protein [candidate division KSB1 bacterium]MDZ7358676.1 DUF2905 domain-containing protein [candidate division KSB1 bacterium]MDZ7402411.1 DUF2905 domain-containing protein [candidate division KSB1 bacterium]